MAHLLSKRTEWLKYFEIFQIYRVKIVKLHWSGLLVYVRVLTSTDDKDDNDITEPERDDDRLFDKNLRFKILLGKKGEKLSNGIGTFFYQKELNDSNIKTKTTVFLKFSKLKNQKTNHILKLAQKE